MTPSLQSAPVTDETAALSYCVTEKKDIELQGGFSQEVKPRRFRVVVDLFNLWTANMWAAPGNAGDEILPETRAGICESNTERVSIKTGRRRRLWGRAPTGGYQESGPAQLMVFLRVDEHPLPL